jgi:hypothetical protein
MGLQYQSLLFYCNSRCLLRGIVVARVRNLRQVTALFLQEKNRVHSEHFRNEYFVSMLAYLVIFWRSSVY